MFSNIGMEAERSPVSILDPLPIYVPAIVVLSILCYDLVSAPIWPRVIRHLLSTVFSPFTEFITLEDIEYAPIPVVPQPWKHRMLLAFSALECMGWIAILTYNLFINENAAKVEASVTLITWVYASCRLYFKPPATPPYGLILFYATHSTLALYGAAEAALVGSYSHHLVGSSVLRLVIPVVLIWIAGTLPLRAQLPGETVAGLRDLPSSLSSSPEDRVDLWLWSSFSFVKPLLDLAMTRTLDETDVWSLSPFFMHKNLFNAYLKYSSKHPSHSLLRFLLVSNSLDLILDVLLEMWSATAGFVPPYALQQILSDLAEQTPESRRDAYKWAIIVFVVNLSFAQVDLFQRWHTRRCYERTRGQLFCALHYKALTRMDAGGKIGDDEDAPADLGKIVNLMQGDAYAVAQRFWEFSGIFAAPVRLGIALVFLYRVLGWSALLGVAIVLIAYILNYPLAKYNIHITRQSWKAKDRRMSLVNELFQNVRFLKFYGWENGWALNARVAREDELRWRVKANVVDTLTSFLWTRVPSMTALICFLCYTLVAGERLTVATAFTAIALFSYLQEPMTALPGQLFAFLHAYVSMQRIEIFLDEPEVPEWASSLKKRSQREHAYKTAFENATFAFPVPPKSLTTRRFTLGPLDIEFPRGELTLVSGGTSSGKSAMLASLLGEMECLGGQVHLDKANHQIAYCAQNPWLEHATIRANIIFGARRGFDEGRYKAVVEACALSKDLEIFEAGDMTEIGERGITLSGGQRARIAMARALYSEATCILLDDPLAAVDMHTAQHLVKHALTGDLASDRTIILVTHHVRLCLPIASYVVELANGQVLRQGTPRDLSHFGMLKQMVVDEDKVQPDPLPPSMARRNEADEQVVHTHPIGKKSSDGKLIEKEARAEGRISYRTYLTYLRAAKLSSWIITFLLMLSIRALDIAQQFFIARWGEAYDELAPVLANKPPQQPYVIASPLDRLPPPAVDPYPWFMIFLVISLTSSLVVLGYIALGYYASLQASRMLFNKMLARLTRAPARFFDTTPIGRILNRFTSDINTVDGALQNSARAALSGTLNFIASFLVIVFVVPTFVPLALFIAWLYVRLAPPYVRASRDLRRLESISLSPAFAGFDELLRGITHVRAFAMEGRYQDNFYKKVDRFQAFDHAYWLVNGWLSWRYDCLGSVVVFCTTVFALRSGLSDGYSAVVIVQAGVFAEVSRQLVRVAAQLELDFNSVERIIEYLEVPEERPAIIKDHRPPAYWPSSNGDIIVDNLVVRYAPELPAVLKNLSFVIKPTEKIGVVGRTGSGKSTLALSLLRMVEPSEGKICVDGIDISTIGLEDLRTQLTIVSQDVSLFSGTIRSNLDPFGEHSDQECWDALEHCHMKDLLAHVVEGEDIAMTLDMAISPTSLSAGEKQLLALSRAVLRRTNIVILDEATASVDQVLDDKIQETIRKELSHATVITIAHRLKTIVDYDRVMVLGEGSILEFEAPRTLLARPDSVFAELCRKSADWPVLQSMLEE